MVDYVVIDAKDSILGRLASKVAKQLLNGDNIVVINADKAIISGSKNSLVSRYKTRLNLQDKANPEHSPYWPRRPDMLVKRIIRGMLPYGKPTGRKVYKNLRVYMGVPEEFSTIKPTVIESKRPNQMYSNYITIKDLSGLLGYKMD